MPQSQIALAACSSPLGKPENGKLWVQVMPCGSFRAIDGRPHDVDTWFIDAVSAEAVIDCFNARKNDTVIDYEHQTLNKEKNGQPAPAAAWFKKLEWREGEGLYGLADLTKKASEHIENKEYRFFSPVFTYDEKTGVVQNIIMGAFTNYAGIDGMQPLATLTALAAEIFLPTTNPEDNTMDIKKILEALGLKPEATIEEILAAIKGLQDATKKPDDEATAALTAKLSQALGITSTKADDVITACTALKTAATLKANPDPSKYAPVAMVEQMQAQMAALSATVNGDKVETTIKQAVTDGKLLPSMVDWARDLGNKDFAALTAYVDKAPAIAALTATQTRGQQPDPNNHNLTPTELQVAALTGITPEDLAKSLKEQK